MPEITPALVGQLRAMTGAGLMNCKKALDETQGDLNAAVDLLRILHLDLDLHALAYNSTRILLHSTVYTHRTIRNQPRQPGP